MPGLLIRQLAWGSACFFSPAALIARSLHRREFSQSIWKQDDSVQARKQRARMRLACSITRGGRALVRQHARHLAICMASAAGPGAAPPTSPPPPAVCVHAASPAELAAAQQLLQQVIGVQPLHLAHEVHMPDLAWITRPATAFPMTLAPGRHMQGDPLVAQRGTAGQPDLHCALFFPGADGAAPQQHGVAGSGGICGTFLPEEFLSALGTRVLGRVLLTADSTPSTQVLAQASAGMLSQIDAKDLLGRGMDGPAACSCRARATAPAVTRCLNVSQHAPAVPLCRRTRPACRMGWCLWQTASWAAKVGARRGGSGGASSASWHGMARHGVRGMAWQAGMLCVPWHLAPIAAVIQASHSSLTFQMVQAAAAIAGSRPAAASCSRQSSGWPFRGSACRLCSTLCRWQSHRRCRPRQRLGCRCGRGLGLHALAGMGMTMARHGHGGACPATPMPCRHMLWLDTSPMARLAQLDPPAPAGPLCRASPSMCASSGPTTCMPAPSSWAAFCAIPPTGISCSISSSG